MAAGDAVGARVSFVLDASFGQQYFILGIPRNDVVRVEPLGHIDELRSASTPLCMHKALVTISPGRRGQSHQMEAFTCDQTHVSASAWKLVAL